MPYALREVLSAFRRAPVLAFLSSAMIALSLFVVGLFGLVAFNIRVVIERMEARVEVVAYLRDSADQASIDAASREMHTWSEVRDVTYITREQALVKARQEVREFDEMFAGIEGNPLPASLEIALKPGQKDAESVRAVARRTQAMPVVEDVGYGNEWLDKVFLLRRVAGVATAVLGIAFAAVAALIIGAAIRLAIFSRRDEIAIMKLVGATNGFISLPFVLEGLITGLIGSLLALLGCFLTFRVLSDSVLQLSWLPSSWVVPGVVAGVAVGVLASMIAVRRHLADV
jgi:cell division transport system permease protein